MLFLLLWENRDFYALQGYLFNSIVYELKSPVPNLTNGRCQEFVDSSCTLVNCKSTRHADGNNSTQLSKQLSTS